MNSVSYETYPARWKKPGKELEVLLPAEGGTCDFKVDIKSNLVYRKHGGSITEERAAKYKEWMIKHDYDPEHGKDLPVAAASEPASEKEPGRDRNEHAQINHAAI